MGDELAVPKTTPSSRSFSAGICAMTGARHTLLDHHDHIAWYHCPALDAPRELFYPD